MRRGRFFSLALCSLLLLPPATIALSATAAHAEGVSGAEWDDSHMRSRYRSVLSTPNPAPIVSGSDRYEQIDTDSGDPARTVVPETLSSTTQHAWRQGPARTPTPATSNASRSFDRLSVNGRRFGSAGSAVGHRGSSLRSSAGSRR